LREQTAQYKPATNKEEEDVSSVTAPRTRAYGNDVSIVPKAHEGLKWMDGTRCRRSISSAPLGDTCMPAILALIAVSIRLFKTQATGRVATLNGIKPPANIRNTRQTTHGQRNDFAEIFKVKQSAAGQVFLKIADD
jgi:hypothetical protein